MPSLPSRSPHEGTILQQQLTEDDAVSNVLTFVTDIHTVEIFNTDASNTGVFTVNGIDITVPTGGIYKSIVGGKPSKEVSIVGSNSYIVSLYT